MTSVGAKPVTLKLWVTEASVLLPTPKGTAPPGVGRAASSPASSALRWVGWSAANPLLVPQAAPRVRTAVRNSVTIGVRGIRATQPPTGPDAKCESRLL